LSATSFSAVVGTTTAAVTTVIALRFLRPVTAVLAGLVIALSPSQILFSAVVLREAHVWLCLALVGLGALLMTRSDWRSLAGGAGLLLAALLVLATCARRRCWPRRGRCRSPCSSHREGDGLRASAPRSSWRRSRRRRPARRGGWALARDALPRPFPWEPSPSLSLFLARLENLEWYLLYALCRVGVLASIRNRSARLAMQFPILLLAMMVGNVAVTQGNLGRPSGTATRSCGR